MALGSNDFDAGKSITWAHPFQWPSKWIFLHQNHYFPGHINNRYINSSLCPLTTPPQPRQPFEQNNVEINSDLKSA